MTFPDTLILEISVQRHFQKLITPPKSCFDSSGLLNIPQVVITSSVVIFVWQMTPKCCYHRQCSCSCTCVFSALAVPGPLQKSSASSSSFSLQVTEEFVNCKATFIAKLPPKNEVEAWSCASQRQCWIFFGQERYIFIQEHLTPGTELDYLSLGYFQLQMQLHLSK